MEFHRDSRSGLAPYLQIVEQVKEASRLGLITPGDQLPTVREVVTQLAVNPNTVLKAYRVLEYEGLVQGRPGQGTFVVGTLGGPPPETYPPSAASSCRGCARRRLQGSTTKASSRSSTTRCATKPRGEWHERPECPR